jgi:uncharacterized membrane-anchored protein
MPPMRPSRCLRAPQIFAEIFYWVTIMFSWTLGTARGDWTADTACLGYGGGTMVFSTLLVFVAASYYWTTYLAQCSSGRH